MKKDCEFMEKCPIYGKFSFEGLENVFIALYCKGDFDNCERKKLKISGQEVPEKLLPNGKYLP